MAGSILKALLCCYTNTNDIASIKATTMPHMATFPRCCCHNITSEESMDYLLPMALWCLLSSTASADELPPFHLQLLCPNAA